MKAVISSQRVPSGKTPAREEWDFRARPEKGNENWAKGFQQFCFLPDDEVGLCWLYEFTRKAPEVDYYLKWRAEAKAPRDFDSLLAHYWLTDPNGKDGHAPVTNWFYSIWPEWPESPFLSIGQTERKARYKKMWGSNPKRKLRLVPLREIYRFVVAVKAGENPKLPVAQGATRGSYRGMAATAGTGARPLRSGAVGRGANVRAGH